jgi:hypothetical protein
MPDAASRLCFDSAERTTPVSSSIRRFSLRFTAAASPSYPPHPSSLRRSTGRSSEPPPRPCSAPAEGADSELALPPPSPMIPSHGDLASPPLSLLCRDWSTGAAIAGARSSTPSPFPPSPVRTCLLCPLAGIGVAAHRPSLLDGLSRDLIGLLPPVRRRRAHPSHERWPRAECTPARPRGLGRLRLGLRHHVGLRPELARRHSAFLFLFQFYLIYFKCNWNI